MTYDEDPARWTSSPDQAPELLRGAFRAARDEGPSRGQMRSLALKLAAASAGGAVAVGTVKAASAGQTLASAASWSVGKIAAVVAIAGTLVTGGAVLWQAGTAPESTAERRVAGGTPASSPTAQEQARSGDGVKTVPQLQAETTRGQRAYVTPTPTVEKLAASPRVSRGGSAAAVPERASETQQRTTETQRGPRPQVGAKAKAARVAPNKPARVSDTRRDTEATREAEALPRTSEQPTAPPSEIELLRRAQVALTGRPREAFQLTQEHRKLYPEGEFTQERDALAIQALMRVGDTDKARQLATAFIRSYPSSPHAHRFREAMGLR